MAALRQPAFDPSTFLSTCGFGRTLIRLKAGEVLFSQGDEARCLFYLHSGRAQLTVLSRSGKEATIMLLSSGDFVGEECISATPGPRFATARAITPCKALRIDREVVINTIHEHQDFADLFLSFLLKRTLRTQADFVDQLFNNSEKRLARILLLMAEFVSPGEPETTIPPITQSTLAEMIGTTRSRVSFFMNRFRKAGFIEYNGRIKVNKSLLNVVLHD